VGVVLAAGGYPSAYEKGHAIAGLDTPLPETTKVFHAGTQTQDGTIVTHGGRVLCVSALGNTIEEAIQLAYAGVDHINWQDMIFRQDIGWRAIDR
jgi:phosphoribosylamine--glycine ligase